MNTETAGFAPGVRTGWFDWLRRELAPFPGRDVATVRIVVTVVLVVIISMALRVPEALLSAYMVFFVTKENKAITTLIGLLLFVGVTIGIAASLLLYRGTFDFPELRIPFMAVVLFICFFFSRVFAIGPLAFGVGFIIAATQSIAELEPSAEALVQSLLWIWVAIAYPIALTVIVNEFLLPTHPHAELLRELQRRIDASICLMKRKLGLAEADERADSSVLELATRGSSALFKLLTLSEKANPRLKHQHTAQCMAIMATERLVTGCAAFVMREQESLTPGDRRCLEAFCTEAERLRTALQKPVSSLPPTEVEGVEATLPEIRELQRALVLLRENLRGEIESTEAVSETRPRRRLLAADAFTNPAHARFALKVTLAAMLCYILYSSVDWAGIHTAFITCCFISLESTGATQRKGALRLAGCVAGGLLGLLSILYLIPRMESIASLALLVAAVSFIAGWVAMGSERIAYAGLQIALAFFMCVLQSFEQDTDLTKIRDRIAGILFGIVATTVIFRYVWPERASDRLRETLACALRDLARLLTIPHSQTSIKPAMDQARSLHNEITTDLDKTFRFAEEAAFEDDEAGQCARISGSTLEVLLTSAQEIYLTANLLTTEAALIEWQRLPEALQQAEGNLRSGVAAQIDRIAAFLTGEPPPEQVNLDAQFSAWARIAACPPHDGRAKLLRQLATQAQQACLLPTTSAGDG